MITTIIISITIKLLSSAARCPLRRLKISPRFTDDYPGVPQSTQRYLFYLIGAGLAVCRLAGCSVTQQIIELYFQFPCSSQSLPGHLALLVGRKLEIS